MVAKSLKIPAKLNKILNDFARIKYFQLTDLKTTEKSLENIKFV